MNFDRVLMVVDSQATADRLQRILPAGIDVISRATVISGRGYKAILIMQDDFDTATERAAAQKFYDYLRTKLAPGKTESDIYWL